MKKLFSFNCSEATKIKLCDHFKENVCLKPDCSVFAQTRKLSSAVKGESIKKFLKASFHSTQPAVKAKKQTQTFGKQTSSLANKLHNFLIS